MINKIQNRILAIAGTAVIVTFSACGSNSNEQSKESESSTLPSTVQSAISAPKSTMSQALKNTLSFMGNEERLAYDVYNILSVQYPEAKQLANIPKSEYKHISAVQALVQKYIQSDADFSNVDLPSLEYKNRDIKEMSAGVYDISAIQNLYDVLYAKGIQSKQDALEVGCMVEVTDINDLNEKLTIAKESGASDVEAVFEFLRDGSYNHYWAFDKGLKKAGVRAGCCTLGVIDGVDYCHPEYPQEEKGR